MFVNQQVAESESCEYNCHLLTCDIITNDGVMIGSTCGHVTSYTSQVTTLLIVLLLGCSPFLIYLQFDSQ